MTCLSFGIVEFNTSALMAPFSCHRGKSALIDGGEKYGGAAADVQTADQEPLCSVVSEVRVN
jgi:hypothetical protein